MFFIFFFLINTETHHNSVWNLCVEKREGETRERERERKRERERESVFMCEYIERER